MPLFSKMPKAGVHMIQLILDQEGRSDSLVAYKTSRLTAMFGNFFASSNSLNIFLLNFALISPMGHIIHPPYLIFFVAIFEAS